MNMPKTDFKVGDLIFVSDDFINNDFHSNHALLKKKLIEELEMELSELIAMPGR
jgi:hypothetical protein